MSLDLSGRVVALIGQGSELDRALAMTCAEAGANLALATVARTQEQEFAMNSIANEAWALGREQFVRLMDGHDAPSVMAFAEETWDRYGRCDALIVAHHAPSAAPLDELSPDEWEEAIRTNLTGPFLAAHAFGNLMDRAGGGLVVLLAPVVAGADAAYRAARMGLEGAAAAIEETWGPRGVLTRVLPSADTAGARDALTALLAELIRR